MLNLNGRQGNSQFSQLSYESRKKLNLLKISLLLGVVFIGFSVYYLQLLPTQYHELMSYFLIMCTSCNLIPIPTLPFVLYISHDYAVWMIVLFGAIGASISSIVEYYVIDFLMKFDRFAKLKQNGKYRKYASYFDKFSFRSIMLASLIPLPLDVIRVLAITRRYSKWKYLLATFLGRIPRIFMLTFVGSQLAYSKTIAIILLAAILIFELTRRVIKMYQRFPVTERGI